MGNSSALVVAFFITAAACGDTAHVQDGGSSRWDAAAGASVEGGASPAPEAGAGQADGAFWPDGVAADGPPSADAGGADAATPSGDSGGGKPDAGGGAGAAPTTCTQVIGYSQVSQWFPSMEKVLGSGTWQLLWNGGAGVNRWRATSYVGWSNAIVSPCAKGAGKPDRVLLSVSGTYGSDVKAWVAAIKATIANIRQKIPTAKVIILQPVVGGPSHNSCTFEGKPVRASWQHAHIDAAIAMVVGGDVEAGFSPEVRTCADYKDNLGHLTASGAAAAGQSIGQHYVAP